MIIYIVPIVILYILNLTKTDDKRVVYIVYALLSLFLCCGYMCGSDWPGYEYLYEKISDEFQPYFFILFEPGYLFMNFVSGQLLGIDFWWFTIAMKFFSFTMAFFTMKKFCSNENFYFALMYFIGFYAYFIYIDAPFRNLIAYGIFFFSMKYIISKDFKKYLICSLITLSIHSTGIFMLLFYFVANAKIRELKTYILIYIVFNILFFNATIITFIVSKFGDMTGIALLERKAEAYTETASQSFFSFGMLMQLGFFILLMFSKEYFEKEVKYGKILFNFAFLYMLMYRLGFSFPILYRIQLYLSIFYSISISYFMSSFTLRSKKCVEFVLFLFCLIVVKGLVTNTYRYVPYTNYIVYWLSGKELDYSYRQNFQFENSPYRQPNEGPDEDITTKF